MVVSEAVVLPSLCLGLALEILLLNLFLISTVVVCPLVRLLLLQFFYSGTRAISLIATIVGDHRRVLVLSVGGG